MKKLDWIFEKINTYGAIKMTMAGICFLAMCGFSFIIVGSYLHNIFEIVAVGCRAEYPHISACNDLIDFGGLIIQSLFTIGASTFFSVQLLKRSLFEMVIALISIFFFAFIGNHYLKKYYANNN